MDYKYIIQASNSTLINLITFMKENKSSTFLFKNSQNALPKL